MEIVIPTLGRENRQTTFENLPAKWQQQTKLVVQHQENFLHSNYERIVLPPEIKDIAATRHYLVHEHHFESNYLLMLDDDLVFSARRSDDPTKFRKMEDEDYDKMFGDVRQQLMSYSHVGVSHREGANRNIEDYLYCTRQMRVLGFDLRTLRKENIGYGRIPVMEDFDTTLRLLRLGYANVLCNRWVHNQGGSNVAGGCSSFRTPEMQEDSAKRLAALHSGLVKTRKVKTKTSWGGEERTDVTIYWKRAFRFDKA